MRIIRPVLLGAVASVLVGACVPNPGAQPTVAAPTPAIAALVEKWEGRWTGSWNGECSVAIEVSDVDADSAYVEYIWSVCEGNASGSFVNSSAFLKGDVLTMPAGGQTTLTFVQRGNDRLDGTFERPGAGQVGRSEFQRVGE